MTGRYTSGPLWGQGPLTLIVGDATYPGAAHLLRVGTVIRMQYVVNPNDASARLLSFQGGDPENEAYQLRRDRGQVIIEHRIVADCRPMKLFLIQTGLGPIEVDLGCWRIPRSVTLRADPRRERLERRIRELETGDPPLEGDFIVEPAVVRRAPADTSRFLVPDGLHLAAREGRPEIVGWLLSRGRDARAVDGNGFEPIHYVGFAQHPAERFVPAFEQSYLAVVDSLVDHGAVVDAPIHERPPGSPGRAANEHEGGTALDLAGTYCADRLVGHLLSLGADPNAHAVGGAPPLTGASINGCPETVRMLLARGARVDDQPQGGGTPLERLISVSAFHEGHLETTRLLLQAGADRLVARARLKDRLDDPGPGGFGFSNRPMARRILALLR
jgi:hypothetical protein